MVTLREARAAKLLSVRGLAEAAGVSPTTVQLIEQGERLPHYGTMRKIAAALHIAPGEIVEFQQAIAAAARGKAAA